MDTGNFRRYRWLDYKVRRNPSLIFVFIIWSFIVVSEIRYTEALLEDGLVDKILTFLRANDWSAEVMLLQVIIYIHVFDLILINTECKN